MTSAIFESPSAEARLERAARWLAECTEHHVTVVGASYECASEIARRALVGPASFGWRRMTLGSLAASIARPGLAARGLVPVGTLALEAVSARVVHEQRAKLGRFAPIGDRPGLPRALSRTVSELRLARTTELAQASLADKDLAHLAAAFEGALDAANVADRARTFALATEMARDLPPDELGPLLFVDVPLRTGAEKAFVEALRKRAPRVFVTVAAGDAPSRALFASALGDDARVESDPLGDAPSALARLQHGLFGADLPDAPPRSGEAVSILSAPGESRECVEIARLVLKEAQQGTRLDRIAVLLRAPQYAAHLEEAFRRARVPAYFARGTRQPHAAGRAMLALLACAAEGISARRFAEYLSLGEVPEEDREGAPPPSLPRSERCAPPDEEAAGALLGASTAAPDEDEPEPVLAPTAEEDRSAQFGTLRAPRHWERLLVDASVIGGQERWQRRLEGLNAKLTMDLAAYAKKGEDVLADGVRRDLAALTSLRRFAMPLVADLAALPETATWGEWIDALSALASRAIRRPERVLSVLAELSPMSKVGPVDVREVRLVLERRLSQLVLTPTGKRYGKVFVATIEEARGLSFDVVFVPGLAEKLFPQKVVEDPLLLDRERARLDADLPTNDDRAAEERLALRLAVGAAGSRVVLSYPRLDVEQARPRTPSFYGLEVLRVADGELRGFEHLAQRAAAHTSARIGWPAPALPQDAIDEAEHDLALLESILKRPEDECVGAAHYLLTANPHLARALRFRGRRWLKAWKSCDGFVDAPPEALEALQDHATSKRSFSPTALQNFASCPYRFLLSAVHRLSPREEPAAIEDLDPLTRGSLVHEVIFELLTKLRDENLLPVTPPRMERARELLDLVLAKVAEETHDQLNPAIERVWQDAIAGIAADLREWLRRMTEEPGWTPAFFELSFGLKDRRAEDPHSTDDPIVLDAGLMLRGSIDLVERADDGRLRATDHKTGKVRASNNETVIGGGEILQPVLYALAIEKMFPKVTIDGGRLYYCTAAGNFERVSIPLSEEARKAAAKVASTIGDAVTRGFLPAAPAKDACRFCDYRSVCGPYEEIRTKRKATDRLKPLVELRRHR